MMWTLPSDKAKEYAYRYEYSMCASMLDEWDEPTGPSTLHIYLHKYIDLAFE
jgi:hypothetical protein